MTNLTTRDRGIYAYKKSMLGQWYTGLVQAAEHGLLGRDVQLVEMSGIPGPRTAGMLINAGYGTGALYDALNQRGAALARQTIPFQFDDAPLVTMAGRAVRVEVAWTTDLAETNIALTDIVARPNGFGTDGSLRWTFGLEEAGSTVLGQLNDVTPHWLFGGTTGSGKTEALKSIVAQLAPLGASGQLEMIIIDGKGGKNYREAGLDQTAGLVGPVATDVAAGRAALQWLVGEMDRRYEHGGTSRPIVTIIDEVQSFTEDAACAAMLSKLTAKGRECRVHILAGTQNPTIKTLGDGSLKRNLPGRCGLRVTDPEASRVVMGDPTLRADWLKGRGHALISAEGALHNVQIAYVPETELRRVPRGAPRLAQWDEADPEVIGARTAGQKWTAEDLAHAIAFAHTSPKAGRPAFIKSRTNYELASRGTDAVRELQAMGRAVVSQLGEFGYSLQGTLDSDTDVQ